MALIRADRVKETTTTTGTGSLTLAGAAIGYRSFSSVCSVGDIFYYAISSQANGEWEAGLATYSALNTLTRTTVHASSNGGNAVNFSAGIKEVFLTLTAELLRALASIDTSMFDNGLQINTSSDCLMWNCGVNDVISWS